MIGVFVGEKLRGRWLFRPLNSSGADEWVAADNGLSTGRSKVVG